MIKILVVDDSMEKIEQIKKVLLDRCGVSVENIVLAKSVSSGLRVLKGDFFDLVILDLLLPQFDNDQANSDGGLSFLRSLNTTNNVKLPLQIICLTEYASILEEKRGEYEGLMVSTIVKKDSDVSWINQLAEKVNYSQKLRIHVENILSNQNAFDVGVVCAIQEEFDMLLEAFGKDNWTDHPIQGSPYRFKQTSIVTESMETVRIIASCSCNPGGISTSALAALLLSTIRVNYLFMTGITGGIKKEDELHLGDIIVAQSVQEYAVGKIAEKEGGKVQHMKENSLAQANAELLNKMSEFISDENVMEKVNTKIGKVNLRVKDRERYKAVIAPTASGPFVMTSPLVVAELQKGERKLRAIDMEGYALYYTAHLFDKPALWIKGVSDMADSNKGDEYHKVSAFGSAYLLNLFIKEKLLG